MTIPGPHHVFEDHTSEVRLRLHAPTLASLFEEAARALAELMLEEAETPAVPQEVTVALHARDREALLSDWLNELVFLSETRRCVYTDAQVLRVSDTSLEAVVRGVPPRVLRTAVKAATLHDLSVRELPGGYTATVVLDV